MDSLKPGQQSLFSIQVDDVVIQRIFAGLQNEIAKLQKEVSELREDVYSKPSRKEVSVLSHMMEEIKKDNDDFAAEIRHQVSSFNTDFSSQLKETKDYAKKEVTDAIFSINNVVRAQNALIEEKIFELTKPTMEFTEMKHSVASVKSSHEMIELEMEKIRKAVAKVLEVKSFDDINDLNLTKVIQNATQADRDNIAQAETKMESLSQRIETAESVMMKICRNPNTPLPQWQTVPKYELKEKPKLPQLTAGTTFYEYIEYLMLLAPSIQKVLTGFYKEITALSNRIWESQANGNETGGGTTSSFTDDQIRSLMEDVDELKLKAISRSELTELKDEVASIKGTDIPKLKLNKLTNDLELLSAKLASIDGIDEKIESMQKTFDTALSKAIRDVQSAAVSPGITPRALIGGNNLPAKTSVTPRGNQAHKIIYGELPPTSAQYPTRHADTRLERKPSIVTRPTLKKPESSLN